MRFVFVLLLLRSFLYAIPCGGINVVCASTPSGYVGLCVGENNVLGAWVDYGYGSIQFQSMGISCDVPYSSPSYCPSVVVDGGGGGSSSFDWDKVKQGFRDSNDVFLWIFGCFVIVRMFGLIEKK